MAWSGLTSVHASPGSATLCHRTLLATQLGEVRRPGVMLPGDCLRERALERLLTHNLGPA